MKTRLLIIIGIIVTIGILQIPESFSEDYFSIPSCYMGIFVNDHVQCSTRDSPPCPEPSFEKNGLCVVKKINICEKETTLKDGNCIPDASRNDYVITIQHLQTGETISDSGMFTSIIIGSFGPILIVLFIVIYAVKKRTRKSIEEKK